MNDSTEQVSDYEALTQELRRQPGATEFAVKLVTEGIELEAFRDTPAGKIIVGSAIEGMVKHLEMVLDPNLSGTELERAVAELRVRHRILVVIEDTINAGKQAGRRLSQPQDPEGNL